MEEKSVCRFSRLMKMMKTEQEMSIQMESNSNSKLSTPSNLVAKLMGLDSLPDEEHNSIVPNGHNRSHSDIPLSYWEEPDDRFFHCFDLDRYRDAYEAPKQPSVVHPPPRKTELSTVLNTSKMPENVSFLQGTQPTRIVVLKPKRMIAGSLYSSQLDSPRMFGEELFGYIEDDDDESHELRKTSNLEADVSPLARHSCDYLSRFGIPYSPSGFCRASYSGESSVSREAKKRLYERWALISSNANRRESRRSQRSSGTLGEMLSLTEVKKKVTKAKGKRKEHKDSNPKLCNEKRADFDAKGSPRNHKRSKSLPTSSSLSGTKLNADSLVVESKHGALKEKASVRSSLKEKIASLFFSKNKKKTIKDKALCSGKKDEFSRERNGILYDNVPRHSSSGLQEHSCIGSLATVIGKQDVGFLQVDTPKKHSTSQNPGENQDHPSPISVLDEQFEEDELLTAKAFPEYEPLARHGFQLQLDLIRSKLLDKSPLIGPISRTLSWDHLCGDAASSYSAKESLTIQGTEGDKQGWILFVRTLLFTVLQGNMLQSTFLSRWHSPESPLDPSLRDIDIIFTDKETTHESKRRQQRSIQKLVFDLVNTLLLNIGHEPDSIHTLVEAKKGNLVKNMSSSTVLDEATSQINAWFCSETICWSDESTLVVERVVTKELSGKGWGDKLRLEMGNLGKEMEQKLLDELVLETLFELIGRV